MTRRKRVLYDRCVGRHVALTIFFTAMAKLHEWLNMSYIILKWVMDASLQEICRSLLVYIPWPLSSTLRYAPILRRRRPGLPSKYNIIHHRCVSIRHADYPLVKAINGCFRIYRLAGPAHGIASVLCSAYWRARFSLGCLHFIYQIIGWNWVVEAETVIL